MNNVKELRTTIGVLRDCHDKLMLVIQKDDVVLTTLRRRIKECKMRIRTIGEQQYLNAINKAIGNE